MFIVQNIYRFVFIVQNLKTHNILKKIVLIIILVAFNKLNELKLSHLFSHLYFPDLHLYFPGLYLFQKIHKGAKPEKKRWKSGKN